MGDQRRRRQQGMGGGRVGGGGLELPPGFRFHPSDEEIITFYLMPKVLDRSFTATAVGEVDVNKCEPWDLPAKAKMGENEWYFYCQRDRKYPTGTRTNRATEAGYWKATGKDKEIYGAGAAGMQLALVGMKKTLVFYKGRAPKGDKSNWVMHEYRPEGSGRLARPTASSSSSTTVAMRSSSSYREEWVVCRVFHKNTGIKKAPGPSCPIAMADGGADESRFPMPMPMPMPMHMQFPMGPDFTMDPAASFYSPAGAGSSSIQPPMPPMAGMGSAGLQMNSGLFGNSMAAAQPMPFYQQMGMGAAGAGGFMAAPESGPSSMVSHDTGMSPDQTNAAEISSVVSAAPASSAATMDMDAIWKY